MNESGEPEPGLQDERNEILTQLDELIEPFMLVLGLAWLVLLVVELVAGLSPFLTAAGTVIWIVFVVEFAIRLVLAPRKLAYLSANWLTLVSLILPALRVFRIARVVRLLRAGRAVRGLRLARVITSINRGIKSLRSSLGRRGFGYALALTAVVLLAGSAGMYAFERQEGLDSYGEALWWTAMLLTTIGSEYWPRTAEGRILCFLLALYAFAVFGYVAAILASYFVGRDAEDERAEIAGQKAIKELHTEVETLRRELQLRREERER